MIHFLFSIIIFFSYSIASGATNVEAKIHIDLSSEHSIEHFALKDKGNLWVHTLNEHQVVEILLKEECFPKVREIKRLDEPHKIFRAFTPSNSVVSINGGFFGFNQKGDPIPIGLVRSGGVRLNSLMPWSSGGFLVSNNKRTTIVPSSTVPNELIKWDETIQSKPILIVNNTLDVRKNSRDSNFNRIAIATTRSGSIYIIGVFHNFGEALTLYEFGKLIIDAAKKRKIDIVRALAMDGGPGAQIYVPQYNFNFGDSSPTYIPNIISIENCK